MFAAPDHGLCLKGPEFVEGSYHDATENGHSEWAMCSQQVTEQFAKGNQA